MTIPHNPTYRDIVGLFMQKKGRLQIMHALKVDPSTARPPSAEYDRRVKVEAFFYVIESAVRNFQHKEICRFNHAFLIDNVIHDVAIHDVSKKSVYTVMNELSSANWNIHQACPKMSFQDDNWDGYIENLRKIGKWVYDCKLNNWLPPP